MDELWDALPKFLLATRDQKKRYLLIDLGYILKSIGRKHPLKVKKLHL